MRLKSKIISVCLMLVSSSLSYADGNKVPYPEGYRNWVHLKSMIIKPGHALENPFQGIHHVYGNQKAIQGLEKGSYADGAVFTFDLLHYVEKDKAIQEGERKLLGVMHKNTEKYPDTGGWGFEGFTANSKNERLTKDNGVSCFACHSPQKDDDYVFSQMRD